MRLSVEITEICNRLQNNLDVDDEEKERLYSYFISTEEEYKDERKFLNDKIKDLEREINRLDEFRNTIFRLLLNTIPEPSRNNDLSYVRNKIFNYLKKEENNE